MLHFVVPVRHPDSVADWDGVCRNLAETLSSLSRQTSTQWRAVVVVNRGAALPSLPDRVEVEHVDLPLKVLPPRADDQEAYYQAFREDKGRRVLAGLRGASAEDHVMVVDYDDWVSRRLAAHAAATPRAPGWYVRVGWVWDGGRVACRYPSFMEFCGTSFMIRRDLLGIPMDISEPCLEEVRRRLGSHKFLRGHLEEQGTPLEPLPFPGAVYRVGTPSAVSGSAGMLRRMTPLRMLRRQPVRFLKRAASLRPVGTAMRDEFGLQPVGACAAAGARD